MPGVADGAPFEITFKVLPSQEAYGDLLRAQLRVLGIDVRVVALETVVFAKTVFTDRDSNEVKREWKAGFAFFY